MNNWNKLSMKDKAKYIKLALDSGITNLQTIRDTYNRFDKGGSLNVEQTKYDLGLPAVSTQDNPIEYNELDEIRKSELESLRTLQWYEDIEKRMMNKRREIAKKYDIPFIPEKEITLTNAGSMTGSKISTNLLDSIYKYSKEANLPLQEAIGLPAQETTFGKYERRGGRALLLKTPNTRPDLITSDWHYAENSPFEYYNKKILNVSSPEIRRAERGYLDYYNNTPTDQYNQEYANLLYNRYIDAKYKAKSDYIKKYREDIIKEEQSQTLEPPLLHAFNYYKTGNYNKKQKDHRQRVLNKGAEVMQSPEFQKWYNNLKP